MVRIVRPNETSLGGVFSQPQPQGGRRTPPPDQFGGMGSYSPLLTLRIPDAHPSAAPSSEPRKPPSPTFASSSPTFHHQCSCDRCEGQLRRQQPPTAQTQLDRSRLQHAMQIGGDVVLAEEGLRGNMVVLPNSFEGGNQQITRPAQLPVVLGICQNCRRIFQTARGQSVDYDDVLRQKRQEENSYRNGDPFLGGDGGGGYGMRGSNSEGYLPQAGSKLDDSFNLGNGLSELSGALSRLQQVANDDPLEAAGLTQQSSYSSSGMDYDNMSYNPRQSRSAPSYNPDDDFGRPPPPREPVSGRRSGNNNGGGGGGGKGQNSKSALRRELEEQAERQRQRREREEAEMKADRFNDFGDPMRHLRGDNNRRGRGDRGGYNPSIYENGGGGGGGWGRRGRGQEEEREWWEKSPQKQDNNTSRAKNHPSQSSFDQPKNTKASLEEDLRRQMEEKQRLNEERKRREEEEDARIERRMREQQDKMRAEYEEEQAKKKAKEEAKIRRQEEMVRKQKELQQELEKQRKEAAERKHRDRRANARNAREKARSPPASARGDEGKDGGGRRGSFRGEEIRPDSPPIPSMRGKVPTIRQRKKTDESEVVEKLSNMREQLEKKEDEVWEGLAEV